MSTIPYDFPSLGGEIVDYSPVLDKTTDLSGAFDSQARATTAELSQCAPRANVIISLSVTPAIVSYKAAWGAAAGGLNPIYAPTVSHVSTGKFRLTFPTTVLDSRGNSLAINFSSGQVTQDNITGAATLLGGVTMSRETANTFLIQTYNQAFALNDSFSTMQLMIWVS